MDGAYFKRMLSEKDELSVKRDKAFDFLQNKGNEVLDPKQRDLLRAQIKVMDIYLYLLSQRIAYDSMIHGFGSSDCKS